MQIRKRFTNYSIVALVLALFASCGSYAYQARLGEPGWNTVPIDEDLPHSTTQWSYLWGSVGKVWTPVRCADPSQQSAGECKPVAQICEGNGVGKVKVDRNFGMGLLSVITLGIVNPSRVTIYCSTHTGVDDPFADPADSLPPPDRPASGRVR